MLSPLQAAALAGALAAGLSLVTCNLPAHASSAKTYANCTAMHKDYPHGVGKKGAHDKTSGKPVTNFKVSNSLYAANTKSDRDHDGIACEKH